MKKILVLTDFSASSRNAFQFARSFFSDASADFHLLYPHLADGIEPPDFVAQMTQLAHETPQAPAATGLPSQDRTDWHTFRSSSKLGKPFDTVQQSIDAEHYDLVVIGPDEAVTDDLFGNSAIALIRLLKANVLVVPADARPKTVQQIVLAIDFAELTNHRLLDPLKELVLLKGATLTLLNIGIPGKKTISVAQETLLRAYLLPIDPTIASLSAVSAKQGIDAYLGEHTVDLLVTMPTYKGPLQPTSAHSHVRAHAFTPPVPLLTLYAHNDTSMLQHIEDLSNLDFAL